MQAPVGSVDEKKRLPTRKTVARVGVSLHFHQLFLLEIFIDKQYKAVGKAAEVKVTQGSYPGWFEMVDHTINPVTLKVSLTLLTTDDKCTRHATLALAACYQLVQSILQIGFALAKKVG